MADLRKFFDPGQMDARTLGMIEFVLNSPAYEEAFKPYLETTSSSMERLWRDRSQKRKDEYPDDFLAGGVCAIEGLLKLFELLIAQTNMERVHEAMVVMVPDAQYEQKRVRGDVRPIVGVDQNPMPTTPAAYDPGEDF